MYARSERMQLNQMLQALEDEEDQERRTQQARLQALWRQQMQERSLVRPGWHAETLLALQQPLLCLSCLCPFCDAPGPLHLRLVAVPRVCATTFAHSVRVTLSALGWGWVGERGNQGVTTVFGGIPALPATFHALATGPHYHRHYC